MKCAGHLPCALHFFGILRPRLKAWGEGVFQSSFLSVMMEFFDLMKRLIPRTQDHIIDDYLGSYDLLQNGRVLDLIVMRQQQHLRDDLGGLRVVIHEWQE